MQNSNDSVIITKIKAMYGKRIDTKQLIELSQCTSVASITSYLKNSTNYSKVLENVNENSVHRGQLENLLKQQIFNNYEKIYHYSNKHNETIFKLIIEEFEILEILKIILLLNAKNIKSYIAKLSGYLIKKCNINLINLAKVKTYENLLDILKQTQYYKILNKLKPKDSEEKINYVACEHELFVQFFNKTFETIEKKLKKSEKNELNNIIKLKIDYLNICIIYREKILFNSPVERIKKRIFPFHKILNKEKIDILINSKTLKEFETNFKLILNKPTKTEQIFNNRNFYIENFIEKLNYRSYKKLIHLSNNLSVVFYTFHKLMQIELSNLIYAIEGVRYGVEAKKIQSLYVV